MKTKGFITVATGKEHYYKLAHNLVASYHMYDGNYLPFSIITEKDNQYTEMFDKVIITGNAAHSYLDMFLLDGNLPYDENIFIESDMLFMEILQVYLIYLKMQMIFHVLVISIQ